MTKAELRELIVKWGNNCNSFLSLYEGFEYFTSTGIEGVIPYFDRGKAWVAAGEPIASPQDQLILLREFGAAAARAGKTAFFIPVNSEFAAKAEGAGYGAIMIGSEPQFMLDRYPKTGQTWLSVVATAKQLHSKGARVSEIKPESLSPERRAELDAITREWLGSRKMSALSFLNKVEPWTLAGDKKYFVLDHGGRATAFLAAIPIWPRGGWYFIDALRRSDTDPGTIELLFVEAMRLLKEQGAREISLGVAPLSNLEQAPKGPAHERLYRLLKYMYANGDQLYNFKSLHLFKLKFQPTQARNMFLLHSPPRLKFSAVLSLLKAFTEKGLLAAAASGAWRTITRFSVVEFIRGQLAPGVVVRSAPASILRLLYRCKCTTLLAVANAVAFVTISGRTLSTYQFTCSGMISEPVFQTVKTLLTVPFLHWNSAHLVLNLFLLTVFSGLLEYLAGSLVMVVCYGAAALLANPLTCGPLYLIGKGLSEPDVGASLGVLAAAGGVAHLLRRERLVLGALTVGCVLDAVITHSWLSLNHLAALAIGALSVRLYLRT